MGSGSHLSTVARADLDSRSSMDSAVGSVAAMWCKCESLPLYPRHLRRRSSWSRWQDPVLVCLTERRLVSSPSRPLTRRHHASPIARDHNANRHLVALRVSVSRRPRTRSTVTSFTLRGAARTPGRPPTARLIAPRLESLSRHAPANSDDEAGYRSKSNGDCNGEDTTREKGEVRRHLVQSAQRGSDSA